MPDRPPTATTTVPPATASVGWRARLASAVRRGVGRTIRRLVWGGSRLGLPESSGRTVVTGTDPMGGRHGR